MNVKQIVKEYLEKNDFDGLYCENCGCLIEGQFHTAGVCDLIPCDGLCDQCEPGFKHVVEKGDVFDGEYEVGEWIVTGEKQEDKP